VDTIKIGSSEVSRFILGSNPFSGFSHQGHERDTEMIHYYTCERIKETLRTAESLGINTIIARADHHMLRVLLEYWDEGGMLQWFGQTCPELGSHIRSLDRVRSAGAPACHIHGGDADHLFANDRCEDLIPIVEHARRIGLTIGLAGHNPETIRWAEQNLDVDYYMCAYYRSIDRTQSAEHRPGTHEKFLDANRQAMTELIRTLSKPAIHYKVLAAGRKDPAEALEYVARNMRPGDAVCVGIHAKDKPDMLAEDVALLERALAAHNQAPAS